jgi:serine/threonine protein kinase
MAVKLLTAESPTAQLKMCMRNEPLISSVLGLHPHIIPIQDVLKSSRGVEGIVMPVCGDNLAQVASTARLRNDGRPFTQFSTYLDACHQVAQGMQHMHAQGVVHLDLKETNVLLGRDGRLLLSDFGFSAREGAKLLVARGTPGYTAPEILQACDPEGAATGYCARASMDVYSAGATFFGLMCGTPLTREGNGYSEGDYSDLTCAAVREEKADVHCSMDDEACRAWLEVLQGCLHRDPERRPTAAELTAVTAQLLQSVRAAEEVRPFGISFMLNSVILYVVSAHDPSSAGRREDAAAALGGGRSAHSTAASARLTRDHLPHHRL